MRFVGKLLLDDESNESLRRYATQVLEGNVSREFHSTVYYSEQSPLANSNELTTEINEFLPIRLNPQTFSFDKFEDNLVLRYNSKGVEIINKLIIENAVKCLIKLPAGGSPEWHQTIATMNNKRNSPIYTEFNPHITLGKIKNLKDIPEFRFPLLFDRFNYSVI